MIPNFKAFLPLSIAILIAVLYFYASSQLKISYKKGIDDATKQCITIQQSNEIAEKKVIIENKNEIIKTKDFQRTITSKPVNNVDKRVQLSELWWSDIEGENSNSE